MRILLKRVKGMTQPIKYRNAEHSSSLGRLAIMPDLKVDESPIDVADLYSQSFLLQGNPRLWLDSAISVPHFPRPKVRQGPNPSFLTNQLHSLFVAFRFSRPLGFGFWYLVFHLGNWIPWYFTWPADAEICCKNGLSIGTSISSSRNMVFDRGE